MNIFNRFYLILVLLFLTASGILAQELTVSRIVKDNEGFTLPGVSVTVKGTTVGNITDLDGNYTIKVSRGSTLVFSYVGFETQEVIVNNQTRIDLTLLTSTIGLEEVVVVGYAEQSRTKVISAVSTVKNEEMRNIPSVSAAQALQGKVAGATIPIADGQPGQSPRVVIRGGTILDPYTSTNSNANPLYIVDGVFRDLTDINPDDIESVQIMKDAASTAMYGARGSNGVVVVKTKTGKTASKAQVTFRYQHGIDEQARKYNYLSAREYLDLARRTMMRGVDNFDIDRYLYVSGNSATAPTFVNKGDYGRYKFTTAFMDNLVDVEGQDYVNNLIANGWETMDDPANPGRALIFKDSHYQDVLWNTAHTNNYNASVSGGGEAVNYNVSLGYVEQGGVFLGTGYDRFSALSNAGYKVSDKLKVDVNFSYLWNNNEYSDNYERDLTRGVRVPPLNRLYNDDGTPNLNESNNPRNRLHQLYYQDNNVSTARTIGRIGADLEIIKGLHFRPSASFTNTLKSMMNFEKYYPEQAEQRNKYQRMEKWNQIMTDHILQYDKAFNQHYIMFLAGFNYTKNSNYYVLGRSQRSATDYIATITGDPTSSIINGVITPNMTAESKYNETKSASFFAQANYDYKNKYLVGASIRRDGFSNFAPENRFAIFPSFSAGWNVHEESFWKVKYMNQLKVRASWGKTGLSGLSMADTYGTYEAFRYSTYSGLVRKNLPNPNLLWETTECIDFGLDMSFFNYRLKFVLDVYNKVTNDRLTSYPLPGETGFENIMYNVGSLRNRGIEVEIDARIIDTKDFTWNSHFTFALNNPMILTLPDNGRENNRINGGVVYDPKLGKDVEVGGYAEGERPLGLWAWKSEGIYATDEEAIADGVKDMGASGGMLNKPKNGGDVKWADLNNDKIIDGKDLVFMGYKTPDKTGGWQNTFSYKGISMRINMDYALGHVISNGALGRSLGQGRSSNEGAPAEAIGNEIWQKQGDTGKKYPRFSFADYDIGYRNHLRMIQNITGYVGMGNAGSYGLDNSIYYSKGDFLALREISLMYTLPKSISKMLYCSNIVINAGVHNVGYLTAYKGLNPEVYQGYDPGGYPRPRQYTIGASVTF